MTIEELLESAKEMHSINPEDYCFEVLSKNRILEAVENTLSSAALLEIRCTTNMVGMVGSGKSTLIKALTYLSRVTEKGSFYADDYYSGYLCGSCLIEGMSVEKEPAAIYGDEPCYSLIKGNPKYTCPFFDGCPVTRMQCEALTASVVITTPQGLAQAKVGSDRRLFLEQVIEQADLVVFDKKLRSVLAELGYTEYSGETLSHIKLFLIIAGFDSYIREVDEQHSIFATENSDKELYNFLSSRFTRQKKLLPTSIMGNLFGIKYDREKGLVLYRQFAYGRALLTSLPWLSMSDDGKPLGPNVLLLSGSSWAEGCLEYHVNVPVRYILESEPWKMEFLSHAEVSELGIPDRVSGSGLRSRREHLSAVISKSMDTIRAELDHDGCILMIVNSYDEAAFAQTQLDKRLEEYRLPYKTARMVRDMKEKSDCCIPRGMLPDFANFGAKILIAPAKAIERGYNIVDEVGHSVFGSLFMMVRPLSNPEDISMKCSKLNGMIDAKFSHTIESNEMKKAADIRKTAAMKWRLLETSSYGLSQLPDELITDVTAGIFVMILQIFGRLARVADHEKEPPRVYFADGSFRASEKNCSGYDCLREIALYLSDLMNDERHGAVASALYKPFYTAFMRGVENNESKNSNSTDGFYSDDECYC